MRKWVQRGGLVTRSVTVDSNGAVSFDSFTPTSDYHRPSKGTSLERIDLTGCIEWCECGGTVKIQFRPSLTTATARDTIVRWLQCDLRGRVHLRYWRNGGWQDEIVGHPSKAIGRFEQIVFQDGGGNESLINRRSKSLRREIKTHRDVVDFWRERHDTFSLDSDFPVLQEITGGRTILLRFDANLGYIGLGVGLGLAPGFRRWMFNKPDQPLSDFPDSHYAHHLEAVYDEAIQSSCPIADEVDGLIKFPSMTRQRHSYHRIITPIAVGSMKYIMSSTIKDGSIDLFS